MEQVVDLVVRPIPDAPHREPVGDGFDLSAKAVLVRVAALGVRAPIAGRIRGGIRIESNVESFHGGVRFQIAKGNAKDERVSDGETDVPGVGGGRLRGASYGAESTIPPRAGQAAMRRARRLMTMS